MSHLDSQPDDPIGIPLLWECTKIIAVFAGGVLFACGLIRLFDLH